MTANLEGTLVLDGLIEGRLPEGSELEPRLREWVTFARNNGVRFNLEIDGNAFSILADDKPHDVQPLGTDPAETIRQMLDQLLELFTPPQRSGVFSTLRSSEYRPGEEVQTVYAVTTTGFEIQQRTVNVQTTPPPTPLSVKERIKLGLMGLGVAVVIVAVASLFLDLGAMWDRLRQNMTPIEPAEMTIQAETYQPWFAIENPRVERVDGRQSIVLTLTAHDKAGMTDAALEAAYRTEGLSLTDRLAIESLRRGYLTVEMFDKEDKLLGTSRYRIAPLRHPEREAMDLAIPIPRGDRPARVHLTF